MKVVRSRLGRVALLSPAGELSINADFGVLHAAAGDAIDDRILGVVVSLDAVTRLDCHAIGQLVDLRRRIEASGRAFCLVDVGRRQREILELLGLIEVLRVCANDAEALHRVERFAEVAWGGCPEPIRNSHGASDTSSPGGRSSWLGRTVGWRHFLPSNTAARRVRGAEEATWPPLL